MIEPASEEIWKDIVGYEGLYQVSNFGRVKSLDRIVYTANGIRKYHGKILKQILDSQKFYFLVRLSKYGIVRIFQVHRLVAQTFIPNPENKPQVNHIDGNKKNNCLNNLEWNSRSENQQHALKNGLRTLSKVNQYDLQGNFIRQWNSVMSAQNHFKNNGSGISSCLNGKCKTAYGYIWKYEDSNKKIELFNPYRRKICQYDLQGNFLKEWKSINKVEKELKIYRSNVWACCNNKKGYKTAGGYIWKYAN